MTEKCDRCGTEYGIGQWPTCRYGDPKEHGYPDGMLGAFVERWDEDIAPEPERLGVRGLPEYDHARGAYKIRSLADVWNLKKANKSDYRGKKVGDPGCMV